MQRVLTVPVLAATAAVFFLSFLAGCGGGTSTNSTVAKIVLTPTSISLNEGAVAQLSAVAQNSAGSVVAADITFTSGNAAIATISSGGLICGGVWDSSIINCNATIGTGGVGQVTITAASNGVTATATVYVHEKVDIVEAVVPNNCTTLGQPVTISGLAFSTSAPGCSTAAPCDITSTVGPFNFGSNDTTIAGSSSGIQTTFDSLTNTPSYVSGGTISGTSGQTCTLSDFNGVNGAMGTVALTGNNTIAAGTQLTITAAGSGGTVAPTSATLGNGTATCSGTATVITSLTGGVLTAFVPGATSVFASVSGVNGVGVPYLTCPVASISIHSSSNSDTSFTMAPLATQTLSADVVDINGQSIFPALTWGSSSTAAAVVANTGTSTANSATITAVAGGTAYITASCSYPACNKYVPPQFGQNVVTATVTSGNPTTVYAASTNSTSLVPINTSTNTAGTAITLPRVPNSIVADPKGSAIYLGSDTGVMGVLASSGVEGDLPVNGTVVAISPDSKYLLLSDSAVGSLFYFDIVNEVVVGTQTNATTSSSAYTPDSHFNEWVMATQFGVGYSTGPTGLITLPFTASALDIVTQGGLTYISSAGGQEIDTISTCDQSQVQTLTANAPTLIKAIPNGTGAVAADSPAIDVVSTPSTLNAGCPVTTQSSINSYDLGAGPFTAQQLFMSSDSSRAWIVSSLPDLLMFYMPSLAPTTIPLTGGANAFNGGITLDGSRVYLGTTDGTVHEIDVESTTDVAQIGVNLKDTNGNATAPNLVVVLP